MQNSIHKSNQAHLNGSATAGHLGVAQSASHEFDYRYVIEILRKYKWLVLLPTFAITFLAGYYAFNIVPTYRSTATLLVEPQKANVVSIEEIYDVDDTHSEYYQTQIELLKSRELARNTIEALDLWNHEELIGSKGEASAGQVEQSVPISAKQGSEPGSASAELLARLKTYYKLGSQLLVEKFHWAKNKALQMIGAIPAQPDEDLVTEEAVADQSGLTEEQKIERNNQLKAIRNFTARLIVLPVRKTKLIRVSYESADPELAATVANEVVSQYIESFLSSKTEITSKASKWLSRRLTELKSTLDNSERRLRTFKRENGLVDVDGRVGRLNEQELLLLTNELSQARSELSSTSDLFRELQALRTAPDELIGVSALQADPLVRQINFEKARAQRALDELLNRYGEKHPKVIDARSQLTTLNESMREAFDRIIESTGKDYKLLQQRVATIEAKLDEGKQEIQEIGSKKFQLDGLEREVATNQKLYDIFFQRYTESRSANGLEEANARVAEIAVPSPGPVRPRKSLITGLAGLGALALFVLISFLVERLDNTVKGTRDVERRLGLRLKGVLPLVKRKSSRGSKKDLPLSPIGNADKAGVFAEAVNAARTSLCLDKNSHLYNIILVTSSIPGEGKTTTSVNLAYSFGQQERVLLIDGDMRRSAIPKAIGLKTGVPGLSDLIQRMAPAQACIQRGVLDGAFDVLPAGHIPDHPLALLTDIRFEKILGNLSRVYDRIIIDSAPVHAVSDALVYGKFADAVVYIIKSHSTPMNIVKQGLQRLWQAEAKIVGAIVTQADMDKLASYGGDIHYGGFYDNYGYSPVTADVGRNLNGSAHNGFDHTMHSPHEYDETEFEGFEGTANGGIRTFGEEFNLKRNSLHSTQSRAVDYDLEKA